MSQIILCLQFVDYCPLQIAVCESVEVLVVGISIYPFTLKIPEEVHDVAGRKDDFSLLRY